ncbi:IpaD/SipD/SspD family type III secretion system needle tip protein [Pseudomonas vanderleydeniana]|uniref:IpaD/SipD/SspD family type III secretion system needle tip protein n=1 Tax=Pseudomonas vanderleydeniana TaxID=2745495 RepID=A0A9E6TR20_9PSED|nr:IpaD/SipD/SspD family type III secretion system needle tip protein [Pseudomonas vanderleydeniana]QXI27101.1 IpaD/SipD/SspD family type III secretion system needle tip protein [Pseudomonas vanderleydeniana]
MDISNIRLTSNWDLVRRPATPEEPVPETVALPRGSKAPLDVALKAVQSQLQRLLEAHGERRDYTQKVLEQRLKLLDELSVGIVEGNDEIVIGQRSIINEVNGALPGEVRTQAEDQAGQTPEFFDKLIELINLIGGSYLEVYKNIVQQYSAFFDAFNREITSKIKDWMEATNEGKEITLNVKQLKAALEKLIDAFSKVEPFDPQNPDKPSGVLFPKPPERSTTDKEAAQQWCRTLGLDPTNPDILKDDGDGNFSVMLDTGPLKQMLRDLPAGDSVTWDSALFQSWQTGFNAQGERLKNKLQEYTQKYSGANSTHDNFIKVLSNHINQFADMLKSMSHT